jgi:hypothetical protein
MPSLTQEHYQSILSQSEFKNENFGFFVETGTNAGVTVNNMLPLFNEIHSIELSEGYYKSACDKFKTNKNVHLHLGDSSKVLKNIINQFNGNTVFFLDGHWSGGDTAKGDKDCPLIEELVTIVGDFKYKALIIIDDYRLFGTKGNEDWSDITDDNIKNVIQGRVISMTSNNDRLVISLK